MSDDPILPGSAKEKILISLLNEVPDGPMSNELFWSIARLVVSPAIEVVILRQGLDGIEVLLAQRSSEDPTWPNQWHTQGTIARKRDIPEKHGDRPLFQRPFERLQSAEFGITFAKQPFPAGTIGQQTKRGPEISHVHVYDCTSEAEPKVGRFFSVNNLPATLIEHQHPVIECAVDGYLRQQHLR